MSYNLFTDNDKKDDSKDSLAALFVASVEMGMADAKKEQAEKDQKTSNSDE